MEIIRTIKLLAAITLVACVFLPMSQCSMPADEGGMALQDRFIYDRNVESDVYQGYVNVTAWGLPCFLALIGIKYGPSKKLSVCEIVLALSAGLCLIGVVFWSDKILWPAYLASVCICLILFAACVELGVGLKAYLKKR